MLGNAIFNVLQTVFGLKKQSKLCSINHCYVYYNHSFPQNLNHWLLEKSEMINLQMLIQKIHSMFKFMLSFWKKRAPQRLPQFLWCRRHFDKCESLGSSTVKCPRLSTTLRSHSICFNFLYFHWKVNRFKPPENVPLLRLGRLSRLIYNYFCGIFSLF